MSKLSLVFLMMFMFTSVIFAADVEKIGKTTEQSRAEVEKALIQAQSESKNVEEVVKKAEQNNAEIEKVLVQIQNEKKKVEEAVKMSEQNKAEVENTLVKVQNEKKEIEKFAKRATQLKEKSSQAKNVSYIRYDFIIPVAVAFVILIVAYIFRPKKDKSEEK